MLVEHRFIWVIFVTYRLLWCFGHEIDTFLVDIASNISKVYDSIHPIQYNRPVLLPHHHGQRCTLQDISKAVKYYLDDTWTPFSNSEKVFVHSPCLGSDSLGNYLSGYFEAMMCARVSGITYISVAKIWEPKNKDQSNPFFDALPSIAPSNISFSLDESKKRLKKLCKCPGICHERKQSLWISGRDFIIPIFRRALKQYIALSNITSTIILPDDIATLETGQVLPLVPDVSIHYRCGDNFVGYYGFLPFPVVSQYIPPNTKTIFVLAESKNRKTSGKDHIIAKCNVVLKSLLTYLKKQFPSAAVVVRRGDDMFVDMYRLTNSPVTICSVSTFCLWPAIASTGVAYFPKTKLVVGGDTSINLGFRWISHPHLLFGSAHEQTAPAVLANLLSLDVKK